MLKMRDTKNGVYTQDARESKELLDGAKLLLNIEDDKNDGALMFLINDTIEAILAYCRLDMLPRQLEGFISAIAAKRFTCGSSGGVKSVTEGDRRVEYESGDYDFISEYAARLKPFVSRAVYVPSEKDGAEND